MSNFIGDLLNQALDGEVRLTGGENLLINRFSEYLLELKKLHCRKEWKDEYKTSVCFRKNSFFSSKDELAQYCRVSIFLACEQFRKIIFDFKDGEYQENIEILNTTIVDYIFDLKGPIEYLERKINPKFTLFEGEKSYRAESFEIFRLSKSLLDGEVGKGAHKTRQIAAVCVLRQSLESRFRRIIGVEFHDIRGNTPKLKHDFHYKFILKNQNYISLKGCNISSIVHVYEWCNDIVHGAYQPLSWQLPFAHDICSPLFYSGENKEKWSIYGSACIGDLDSMRQKFLIYFADSYDHGTWCVDFMKPDALI